MAQSPKGRLIQGLYKPVHGNCAIYFYPGVIVELDRHTLHTGTVTNLETPGLAFLEIFRKHISSDGF